MLDDGTALYDSRVIVEFLDNVSPIARLIPDDNRERVAVRRWEALADGVLDAGLLIALRVAAAEEGAERGLDRASRPASCTRGLAMIAAELGDKPWCHGDRYTLADIAVGCCLGWLDFRNPAASTGAANTPNLARHYDKLMERPAFADTVPPENQGQP